MFNNIWPVWRIWCGANSNRVHRRIRDQFRLGGLRSVAPIFSPLLARKSSDFALILHAFLPENGYLKKLKGAAAPPPPHPPHTPMIACESLCNVTTFFSVYRGTYVGDVWIYTLRCQNGSKPIFMWGFVSRYIPPQKYFAISISRYMMMQTVQRCWISILHNYSQAYF